MISGAINIIEAGLAITSLLIKVSEIAAKYQAAVVKARAENRDITDGERAAILMDAQKTKEDFLSLGPEDRVNMRDDRKE